MIIENGRWVDGTPAAWFEKFGEPISLTVFVLLSTFVCHHAKKAE